MQSFILLKISFTRKDIAASSVLLHRNAAVGHFFASERQCRKEKSNAQRKEERKNEPTKGQCCCKKAADRPTDCGRGVPSCPHFARKVSRARRRRAGLPSAMGRERLEQVRKTGLGNAVHAIICMQKEHT